MKKKYIIVLVILLVIFFVWFVPIKRIAICIGATALYDPSGKYDNCIWSYSNITLKDYLFSWILNPYSAPLSYP